MIIIHIGSYQESRNTSTNRKGKPCLGIHIHKYRYTCLRLQIEEAKALNKNIQEIEELESNVNQKKKELEQTSGKSLLGTIALLLIVFFFTNISIIQRNYVNIKKRQSKNLYHYNSNSKNNRRKGIISSNLQQILHILL